MMHQASLTKRSKGGTTTRMQTGSQSALARCARLVPVALKLLCELKKLRRCVSLAHQLLQLCVAGKGICPVGVDDRLEVGEHVARFLASERKGGLLGEHARDLRQRIADRPGSVAVEDNAAIERHAVLPRGWAGEHAVYHSFTLFVSDAQDRLTSWGQDG